MRRFRTLAALAVLCVPASAYYHFVYYINGAVVREKFDLTAVPNNTVTLFVSEAGPTVYNKTDTFNSVVSQIAQAAQVWNGVTTSALRIAFGGLENASTTQNTPGADVVFEDLPPGLYGYGGPTSTLSPATAADGTVFIPITRSAVHMNRNLTIVPNNGAGPSYTSTFFLTCVHEIGHAMGLQHTFTSSAMSVATTSATTLSHPIDADDMAGISLLYPAAAFAQLGTISGRITNGSAGVHLASVVAIPQSGWGSVSALTNPDGTFQIQGVPPGQYYVYAHTLPPTANILGPWNADGSVAAASGTTNALFFSGAPGGTPGGAAGGTTNPAQATQVTVVQGGTLSGINIGLASRASVEVYDVQLFSYYLYNNAYQSVEPAFADVPLFTSGAIALNATGQGLGSNGKAPGLSVQTLGSSLSVYGMQAGLSGGSTYVSLYLALGATPVFGPQHVVFNTPDYMYVQPDALTLAKNVPPTVTAARANGDGTATITGTGWAADTLLYFDGLPSAVSSLDPVKGTAVVTPPVGSPGQTSVITAYNSDGQNSEFLQAASPVTYGFGNVAAPVIASINPSSLPAGAEALVDITGSGFNFLNGTVAVGFGTSDILVRRIYVVSSNHLIADVSVAAGAALGNPDVSVVNGFQIGLATAGFQITAPVTGLPSVIPVMTNAVAGLNGAYAGATVTLAGSNLAAAGTATTAAIGGQTATVLSATASSVTLVIPSGLSAGPAVLTLSNGTLAAYPVEVSIDAAPAGIDAIQETSGAYIDSATAAHTGDTLIVTLSNFAPSGTTVAPGRVQVGVAGVLHSATAVTNPVAGIYQVTFQLNTTDPVGQAEQLVVYLDGHSSLPAAIAVANPDGTFTTAASGH